MVRVNEDIPQQELDHYNDLGVRAIRLDLFARAQWPAEDIITYIRTMAELARPRGRHLQFYSPGAVIRNLMPFLADLEDRFVLDHMGYGADADQLRNLLQGGNCWIKLSGPYRLAKGKPLSEMDSLGRALVRARPDRLLWGSDWPHLPDGQRDTGEVLNLLAGWAPDPADRRTILTGSPAELFFADQ